MFEAPTVEIVLQILMLAPPGKWIAQTPIPDQTLESREIRLEGREKELLLGFVRRMLQWLPEQRPSADDLWGDPFLNEVYRET